MKQITVIGASAGVGLLTVQQALKNGNKVVALSRHIDTLPDQPNLISLQGSSTSLADVKKAVAGSDVIIVTIGTGSSTKATTLYTESARVLLQALAELNVQPPLLVVTGFGAGDSAHYQSFLMSLVMRFLLKAVYADKTAMEELITSRYPNWVIVRPGRLIDDAFTGLYRVETRLVKGMQIGKISRADVAHFLVKRAELFPITNQYISLSS
ncbi:NAD(P)-dependent oxidoreductase [Spirosoma endophyticum]|uniref:Putative NADH-flavin reductase n=1 Tax=Spirosoma endophyticum TaxID=662367 RepID=A0A1I1VLD0_9BACT|nr:NAD(P)H-binding protein [Spirosoma endophyticum]SFD83816.1 Putative NADH-flavin reductase [Spirosoma endophyticum]